MSKITLILPLVFVCLITGPIFARGGGGGGFHGGGGMHGAGRSYHMSSHHGYTHGGQHGYAHGGHHGGWRQGQYYAGRGYWGFNPGFGWGFWPIAYAIVASDYVGNNYDDDQQSSDDEGVYDTQSDD